MEKCDKLPKWEIFTSPRVGLSLKRADKFKREFVMKSYRFFTSPKALKKGKNLMVFELLGRGEPLGKIE